MFRTNDFMASSSARTGPSGVAEPPRPYAYAVAISLTSNRTNDKRIIHLPAGENVVIGRASRSELKNLQAAPHNALFDCPVVSRQHAELRNSMLQVSDNEVTINDCYSLHGTTVNGIKLVPGVDFVLKSGDVIQLGEKVLRGGDTHDDVSLTFNHLDNVPLQPPTANRFKVAVPVLSDVDDDDDEENLSDDDENSIYSLGDASSPNTTPEQHKQKMGSQAQPIQLDGGYNDLGNVDDLSGEEADANDIHNFIDLSTEKADDIDDDDDLVIMTESSSVPSTQLQVIPDTYEDNAQKLTPAAVAIDDEEQRPEPARDHSTESPDNMRLRLSEILNHYDDAPAPAEDDEEGSEIDDVEYDPLDQDQLDSISESNASELSGAMSESESDASESDYPVGFAVSSELGDPEGHHKADHAYDRMPLPAAQSLDKFEIELADYKARYGRYDPVRGSQPPAIQDPKNSMSVNATSHPAPYTYGSFGYVPANTAIDSSTSSRWDIQPPAPNSFQSLYVNNHGSTSTAAPRLYAQPFDFNSFNTLPPWAGGAKSPSFPSENSGQPVTPSFREPPQSSSPASAVPAQSSFTKRKISILDIVEELEELEKRVELEKREEFKRREEFTGTDEEHEKPGEPAGTDEEARTTIAQVESVLPEKSSVVSTKRKAFEMEAEEQSESTEPAMKRAKVAAPRRGALRRMANSTAAHLVTGAAVGMGATIWFLDSPYAQHLLEWLG